ncbi:MAG: CoA transferase [Bacteriovoracaceae bacterium]|nr:CoA transferase [Bacteriovoracaceae bacterium]
MDNLLKGITVLDFSHRLPGPLGMNILGKMGAKVIKIEDAKFGDAFVTGLFSSFDPSFEDWYKGLNEFKEIIKLDFKAEATIAKLHTMIKNADAILMTLPDKIKTSLKLTDDDLKKIKKNIVVVEMGSSTQHQESMHDLNAMALTGMMSLHVAQTDEAIVAPPFLPISGIFFGQQLATQLLAGVLKAQREMTFVKTTAYLYDTADFLCKPLWSQNLRDKKMVKFLHNGAFPCYCIYRTNDHHYVGVAAVEEKFWNEFSQTFEISLPANQRFDQDKAAFLSIAKSIGKLNLADIEKMLKNKDMCVSIIKKVN